MPILPPSPGNFTYKKLSSVRPAPITLHFPNILNAVTETKYIYATGGASWLRLSNIRFVGYDGYATLSINTGVADTLEARTHSLNLQFTLRTTEADVPGAIINTNLGTYRVNLTVTDTVRLSIDPTTFSFKYKDGDPSPLDQELRIISENNWTIVPSESWVTISHPNGNANASIMVGVNVAGLDFGFYEAIVTVNDGYSTAQFKVYLTVDIPQTVDDYIFLNPQNLEFLSQQGVANGSMRNLIVDAGNDWDIEADKPWLQFSQVSGNAGITEIQVSVDSDQLSIGIYSAQITAVSGGVVKKAYVVLRVIALSVVGLEDDGVYFADDRIHLSIGSIGENSFLQLNIEASTETQIKNYITEQPYFRGIARALIGRESNLLIEKIAPPSDLVSGVKEASKAMVLKIDAYEQNRFSGVTSSVANYSNIRFLKGASPRVPNRLCYLPDKVTKSGKGVVILHVRADDDPGDIVLSGAVEQIISGPSPNNELVYSALVNLSEFDLKTGDSLDIAYGDQTVQVDIDNDIVESNLVAFENEWGLFEFFETKGFKSSIPTTKQKTFEISEEGKTRTVVFKAPRGRTYKLDTGNMMTDSEVAWMSMMLFSKRIYVYENNTPVEVTIMNRNILEVQTRRRVMNFVLEFKKAIEW